MHLHTLLILLERATGTRAEFTKGEDEDEKIGWMPGKPLMIIVKGAQGL